MMYPDWCRPLKRNPEFNRNVMYGRHPVGFRLLEQEPVTLVPMREEDLLGGL